MTQPRSSSASRVTARNSALAPNSVTVGGWVMRPAVESAAVEHNRWHISVHSDIVDPQNDNGVVSGRDGLLDRTLQPHAGAFDEDRARFGRNRMQAGEPVTGFGGQRARGLVVRLPKHADAQVRQVLEPWPCRRGVLHAERHQRRFQRDRHEGARRQTHPRAVDFGGDRDDAGREMPERLPQCGGTQIGGAH